MKIDGIGEVWEGFLERDPLSEKFHLRVVRDGGVAHVDIQKMLESYIGQEVRVAVSSLEALRTVAERLGPTLDGVETVTLGDLNDSRPRRASD